MKKFFALFFTIYFTLHLSAQTIDPKADSLYNKIMGAARPEIKNWVYSTASKYRTKDVDKNILVANKEFGSLNLKAMDLDALTFLLMMQMSKDAESDLRQSLQSIKMRNAAKATQREQLQQGKARVRTDSLHNTDNSLGGNNDEQLKLQLITDRRQKALETISNLMKKMSETQNSIIQNLK